MKEKVLQIIYSLQNAVFDIQDLNCGGCAVFAAAAAKRLNRLGVAASVRIGSRDDTDALKKVIHNNEPLTKDNLNSKGVVMDHLIVECKVDDELIHFDSECIQPAADFFPTCRVTILDGNVDVLNALRLAKEKSWNPWFERSQIPAMFKKMNEAIKQFSAC